MRNKRLDVLRCVAVFLVLLNHADISSFFIRVGWVGVDLFFVLSGFLISGLLFSDHKKNKTIQWKRFLLRRGLKIYPAFYTFLLLIGLAAYLAFHFVAPLTAYLHEIFFVMNYEPRVWAHTWSLAVEEHFYFLLPIFLLGAVHFSSDRENPFRILPRAMAVIAVLCIGFRAATVYIGKPDFEAAYMRTHMRMDSLFFGVLIGYFWHFRRSALDRLMAPAKNCVFLAAISGALLSSSYFWSREGRFFATFGYSFLYLGFSGVLLLCLYVYGVLPAGISRVAGMVGGAMAHIGMYSYSIYLWHIPLSAWLAPLVRRVLHISTGPYEDFGIYFAGSIAIGILMSKLIEYPVLRMRDKLFPAPASAPVVGADDGSGIAR